MYGFSEMTKKCVEMVRENAGVKVDILVVDDGSKDPYWCGFDGEQVLRLEENTGYTNAINQGILWCGDRYKYVHLLNNDVTPRPDFLKILYDHMETHPETGIACSIRLTIEDGQKGIELYGVDLIRGHQTVIYDWDKPITTENSKEEVDVIYCDWVPVCSALVRMEMARYIGILDRRFRNHCSDSDYCIRANQNGWNVALLTKSKVEHIHRVTIDHHDIKPYDDQKLFIEKITGIKYQELFNRLPIDCELNTWGRLDFMKYTKNDNADKSTPT
jgi:GT2 family glycosyltransferase